MDSLDLTFVRCPSCRSLVPAISTRCRMCGASLEATASADSISSTADKSTSGAASTSGSSSEAMIAKGESTKGTSDRSGVIKFDDPKQTTEDEDSAEAVTGEDPLSAYVEELSTGSTSTDDDDSSAASSSTSSSSPSSADNESTTPVAVGSAALESQSSGATTTMAGSAGAGSTGSRDVDDSSTGSRGSRGDSGKGDRSRQPFEARRNSSERRYQQPTAQGSGSQHGSREQSNNNNRRTDMKGSESSRGESSRGADLRGNDSRRSDVRGSQTSSGVASSGSAALARTPSVVATPGVVVRPRETQVFGSGRLVGWLVSYADTRGASLELREGKFFVTAKSIKENDLVLDDRSVSTPHALIGCGLDGALTVQDLMSERGVFVRRRGSNQYRQEEEAIPVEHGDWLRFGDLEFLVVLIPAGME